MIHAAERYTQSALQRAWLRVLAAADSAGVEYADLPDDLPTDLQDEDGEPLTLGCLIEDMHHDAGVTDDEGNLVIRPEVPEEMYVSRADAIRAWKIGKAIDADEDVSEADIEFMESVNARKKAYRESQKALREAAKPAEDGARETDLQRNIRLLKAAGYRVEAVSAPKERPAEAEEGEEDDEADEAPPADTPEVKSVKERIGASLRRRGLRRKADVEAEEVVETPAPVAASA